MERLHNTGYRYILKPQLTQTLLYRRIVTLACQRAGGTVIGAGYWASNPACWVHLGRRNCGGGGGVTIIRRAKKTSDIKTGRAGARVHGCNNNNIFINRCVTFVLFYPLQKCAKTYPSSELLTPFQSPSQNYLQHTKGENKTNILQQSVFCGTEIIFYWKENKNLKKNSIWLRFER